MKLKSLEFSLNSKSVNLKKSFVYCTPKKTIFTSRFISPKVSIFRRSMSGGTQLKLVKIFGAELGTALQAITEEMFEK